MKELLLLPIFLLFSCYLPGQDIKPLKIVVSDSSVSSYLSGVTIIVGGQKKAVYITDNRGRASIPVLPGNYLLQFSCVGYKPGQRAVSAADWQNGTLNVRLQPAMTQLGDVQVSGLSREEAEARAVRRSVMPVTVITAKEIENRASDLNEILTRQAGVQVRETGGLGSESHISVRGLEGKRVEIYIDGNPLNSPDGSISINDIPLQFIERIEIYKGTIPAWLGGDGLGSAVNVIIKHRDLNYLEADAAYQSFNTRKAQLAGKYTFEKLGLEAGAGIIYSAADNNYTMASPYQAGLVITRDHDKYLSSVGGINLRFTKWWFDEILLEGILLHNRKDIQGIQYDIQQAYSYSDAKVGSMTLKKNNLLNGKLNLNEQMVIVGFTGHLIDTSQYQYHFNAPPTPSLTGRGEVGLGPNTTITPQKEIRQRLNVNYKLNDIFSLNLNNALRSASINPSDSIANRYAGRNLYNYPGTLLSSVTGLTLEGNLLNDRWLFSTALKHYYYNASGYNTSYFQVVTPDKINVSTSKLGYNAGVRYNITSDLLLKGSYEKAIRLPLPAELFGNGSLITPSINLQPEQADNYTVGLIYDRQIATLRRIQIEGNVFYMNVSNLIQLGGIAPLTEYQNYAKANISGADGEVKYDLSRVIYLSANVTYQRLTDRLRYIPGTDKVPNPTYQLQIPNVAPFFTNWNIEFHRNDLLGKGTKTRLIYEGSFVHKFYYGYKYNDDNESVIPGYNSHNIIWEQSFKNQRYTITGEIRNITSQVIIDEYNNPLPGRSFLLRLRMLLTGTHAD